MTNYPHSAGPRETWHAKVLRNAVWSAIIIFLTTIWTILRIYARRLNKSRLLGEDWVYLAGQLFCYGVCSCSIALVAVGPPTSQAVLASKLRMMLAQRLCYAITLFCAKLSVILLIRRIFGQISRTIRVGCRVALIVSVCWAIYSSVVEFVICMPVQSSWDPSVREEKCMNRKLVFGVVPAWDIPIEVLILGLPIPSILSLRIAKADKFGLLCVFGAGLITITLSGVYLYFVINNFHLSYVVSVIHSGIALMVASSTTLQPVVNKVIRPWVRRVLVKFWGEPPSIQSGTRFKISLNTVEFDSDGLEPKDSTKQRATESEESLAMTPEKDGQWEGQMWEQMA